MTATPLTDLTRKGQPNFFKWAKALKKAFNTLQEALLNRSILKLSTNYSREVTLRADVYNNGIVAMLIQEHEGKLHSVA